METKTTVPTIYQWEDKENGVITAAFTFRKQNFGFSYPIDENVARNNMNKTKLFNSVREALDVLVHHGTSVVDRQGRFIKEKVEDAEYRRRMFDPLWGKQVEAFNKVLLKKEITKEEARNLKLL